MQTFERWYNIDVVYEDASLADIPYTGSVKRYESILPFLEALQLTTGFALPHRGTERLFIESSIIKICLK